jgi:ADP-heptose:LPS heptosyltransferase/Flp pilus assembly protein TadD
MNRLYLCALLASLSLTALSPEEKFAQAYEMVNTGDYDQALNAYQELHRLFPTNIELLNNMGFVLKKQNKMLEAIEIYQKSRTLASTVNSRIERAISHAYLALGDFEHGWPAYEYRWVNPPSYNQELKNYINQNSSLENKTVLLHTEYGLGDTLQFIRYAQALKSLGARVIVESQPALVKLLSLCSYIDQVFEAGASWPMHDFKALLMSLPLITQNKTHSFYADKPYIFADQTLCQEWQKKIAHDKNFKIGICWQADTHKSSAFTGIQHDSQLKSIALKQLIRLCKLPNISLYSLQKINGLDQIEQLPNNAMIHHFADLDTVHGAFMDTAALIKSVDLVITIDTSIAHLSGALGVPTYVILPHHADWRWQLGRQDSPWYPTMKLFRQTVPGDWDDVISSLMQELIKEHKTIKSRSYVSTQISFEDLGLNAIKTDELHDAYLFHQHMLSNDPHNLGALNNCAYILSRLNKFAQAIEYYEKLLSLKPDSKGARLGLAKAYLAIGNYSKGWKELEWRFPNPADYQSAFGYMNISPKDVKNKIVLIRAEWGFGDMIQFVRYAPLLKQAGAKKVIVQMFDQLQPLLSCSNLADEIISVGAAIPHADIQIPCMSLPLIFATQPETIPAHIPYLHAQPALVESWKQKLENNAQLKVGICWRAKQIGFIEDFKHTRRSITLEHFANLLNAQNVAFYNLQKDADANELQTINMHGVKTFDVDFDESNGRFMDTAAVIMNLDLIITADTCTAHLAAALGKDVWLILPFTAEWRWLPGDEKYNKTDRTPWYPHNMRLFKQRVPGDWKSVINEIKRELVTRSLAQGSY